MGRVRSIAALGVLWMIPGLLQFLQEATWARAKNAPDYDGVHSALLFLPSWLPWLAFTYGIATVTRELLRRGWSAWAMVPAHLGLAGACGLAHLAWNAWILSTFPPPHFPIPGFVAWLRQTLWSANVQGELLAYAGVVAATLGWDAHGRRIAAEREGLRRALTLETQLAEARLEALSAQIRPHFLFNVLNSVQALIVDDAKKASEMISRIAELLRSSMREPRQATVPLSEELSLLEPYLEIERLRFGDRVKIGVEVDPRACSLPIPPWTLQPLVENALRHGVGPREEGGTIEIVGSVGGDGALVVDVRDDGVGPGSGPASAAARGHGPGIGLRNVRARIAEAHGVGATAQLSQRADGGALVRLTLPRLTATEAAAP